RTLITLRPRVRAARAAVAARSPVFRHMEFAAGRHEAEGYPGYRHDHVGAVGRFHRIADDRIDIHHVPDVFHGGLHESLDRMVCHRMPPPPSIMRMARLTRL